MLSDHDQRVLTDLQTRVQHTDPAFATRMANRRDEVRFPTVTMLCAGLFVLIPPVMLLFGRPGLVVMVSLFSTAVAAILVSRIPRGRKPLRH